MKKLLFAILLIAGFAQAQTTTTITGTIKDLSGALITSGQVAFTLQPGIDTSMSGVARFSLSEIDCLINGSGLVKALDGTSACTLTQNTAITSPSGTSYKGCIQPGFIQPGSCFVFYAIGSTLDITTTPATPSLTPAYSLVDTFSNQTIAGNKSFTGTINFSGTLNIGALTLSGLLTATSISIPAPGGTLPATIANDTVGGINITANSGKAWEFANSGSLSSPLGAPIQFNGATSGLINVAAPAIAGANNLTWPAATGVIVADVATQTLTNKTLTNPAINGQIADTINQKAATAFLLKDNTGGTRYSIPSGGSAIATLNNTNVGGGSTCTSCTITTGLSQGSGMKHQRVAGCTTAASVNAVCGPITLTWTSAFADTSYTLNCFPTGTVNTGFITISTKAAGAVTLFGVSSAATAWTVGSFECIAIHD